MFWIPWPKTDQRGIARYVDPALVEQLVLPVNRLALEQQGDRLTIVAAIYELLASQGIRYALSPFSYDDQVQRIRAPRAILAGPQEGTCLDLALLFSAVCLANDLLPLVVAHEGHAYAAVALGFGLREFDARPRRQLCRLDQGLMAHATLAELVDRGLYVVVECTGFATTGDLSAGPRAAGGRLSFDQAREAALATLGNAQSFRFAADIATLHQKGYRPFGEELLRFDERLAVALIAASSLPVRQALQPLPRAEALRQAVAEALHAAVGQLRRSSDPEHDDDLLYELADYLGRENVLAELTLLLDPQEGRDLDVPRLRAELRVMGLDEARLPDATADRMLRALLGGFVREAERHEVLREPLKVALLRQIAERLGALGRIMSASERTAEATAALVEQMRVLVQETAQGKRSLEYGLGELTRLMSSQIDLYQSIAAGLGRAQVEVVVAADGAIRLDVQMANEGFSPAAVEQLRTLLVTLRHEIRARADDPAQLALLRERYLALIIHLYQHLRLEGLTTDVKPISLPLEKVYVQLRAVGQIPERADTFSPEERRVLRLLEEAERKSDAKDAEVEGALREAYLQLDALQRERWDRERLERFPISKALANPAQRVLVILGDPGSGKTTLLQFLALTFARGPETVAEHLNLTGEDASRLPIIVPLASYDEMERETGGLTVAEFLGRYYDRRRAAPGLDSVFAAALEAGRALVLLDGLDEVTNESRRRFVTEQVEAFIATAAPRGNRVILTSRIYGYRAAPIRGDYPHITVLDFRRDEIEIFARQWQRALAVWEGDGQLTPQQELLAQQRERDLLRDILSNPGVERLAVNPLLLTMLALLRRQVGSLPQRRIKLYDLYITALVQTWEENRSRGARATRHDERIDLKDAEGALIHLALWMQQNYLSGTATGAALVGELTTYYLWDGAGLHPDDPRVTPPVRREAEVRAERFVRDMRQYSGLLIERGYDAFGFRHLTFQEYFAGWGLAGLTPDERWSLVAPHLHSNRWREPILLCAARLGVIDQRSRETTALVQRIADAGSELEALLHRDLFLAADCASDDIGIALATLEQLADGLAPLLTSPIPSLAQAALDRLHRLAQLRAGGQPRLPGAARRLFDFLAVEKIFPAFGAANKQLQQVLQSLLAEHEALRAATVAKLEEGSFSERQATVLALSPLLAEHGQLRAAVVDCFTNRSYFMRRVVVLACAPHISAHPELYNVVVAALDDTYGDVRTAALEALAPVLAEHSDLQAKVAAQLQDKSEKVRATALTALTPLLATHAGLRASVAELLHDPVSRIREAAVRALAPFVGDYEDIRSSIRDCLTDSIGAVRRAAVEALVPLLGADPDLRQHMLGRLHDEEEAIRRAAATALSPCLADDLALRQQVCARLADQRHTVQVAAIMAVEPLLADDAIRQQIIAMTGHSQGDIRYAALAALAKQVAVDPSLVDYLITALHDEHPGVREGAVEVLCGLPGEWPELRSRLLGLAHDDFENVRSAVVKAIGSTWQLGQEFDEQLQALFEDDDYETRLLVIETFAQRAALPVVHIAKMARNTNALPSDNLINYRALVVDTIVRSVGFTPPVTEALLRALQSERMAIRTSAIMGLFGWQDIDDVKAIVEIGPERVAQLPDQLEAALKHQFESSDLIVRSIVPLLFWRHCNRMPLQAKLVELTSSEFPVIREGAVLAVGRLAGDHPELRAVLCRSLEDDDPDVRQAAIRMLLPLLPGHAELRALVRGRLSDQSGPVREAAVTALAPFAADHDDLRAALLECLKDEVASVREAALSALAPLLADEVGARDAVSVLLEDRDEAVQHAATRALGPLLASFPDLRSALGRCLGLENFRPRQQVALLIAPFLDEDKNLLAQVRELLDDQRPHVREAALQALAPLLVRRADLRPAWLSLLEGDDYAEALVDGLAPAQEAQAELWALALTWLQGENHLGRLAAVQALAPHLAAEAHLRATVRELLTESIDQVRLAAVRALAPSLAVDEALRAAFFERLQDEDEMIRGMAAKALSPFVAEDDRLRHAMRDRLQDESSDVRQAAIEALKPLLAEDAGLRQAVLSRCTDFSSYVRVIAIRALAPLLGEHAELRLPILARFRDPDEHHDVRPVALVAIAPYATSVDAFEECVVLLGRCAYNASAYDFHNFSVSPETIAELEQGLAQNISADPACVPALLAMLGSDDWRLRLAVCRLLAATTATPMPQLLPALLAALDNQRGPEAWPARIAAAELLLNDTLYTNLAVETILPALDYDRDAIVPDKKAVAVRKQAALALGKLKAAYRQSRVVARITALLAEEQDPQVLDGLFDALTSLSAAPEQGQQVSQTPPPL